MIEIREIALSVDDDITIAPNDGAEYHELYITRSDYTEETSELFKIIVMRRFGDGSIDDQGAEIIINRDGTAIIETQARPIK